MIAVLECLCSDHTSEGFLVILDMNNKKSVRLCNYGLSKKLSSAHRMISELSDGYSNWHSHSRPFLIEMIGLWRYPNDFYLHIKENRKFCFHWRMLHKSRNVSTLIIIQTILSWCKRFSKAWYSDYQSSKCLNYSRYSRRMWCASGH